MKELSKKYVVNTIDEKGEQEEEYVYETDKPDEIRFIDTFFEVVFGKKDTIYRIATKEYNCYADNVAITEEIINDVNRLIDTAKTLTENSSGYTKLDVLDVKSLSKTASYDEVHFALIGLAELLDSFARIYFGEYESVIDYRIQ